MSAPRVKSWCAALLVLCCAPAANAAAVTWVKVVGSGASQIFVDTGSIRQTGDIVSAWYRRDFNRPMLTEKKHLPYRSSKVLSYYNCADREVAPAQWITYEKTGGMGKVISNEKVISLSYGEVPRGEAGEAVFDFVCKYVKQQRK